MKQLFQSLLNGSLEITELPLPKVKADEILIKTNISLISAGTERMLINFGKANPIEKIKSQPDKVRQVINKVKNDGALTAFNSVSRKLNDRIPLGYSNAGVIIEVGSNVIDFKVGERVVSNGPHSEVVVVNQKLCAKIPEGVKDENACFAFLGAISLNAIRLLKPTFGETFVVSGLGLLGLLSIQLLKANGCRVLGIDIDDKKCKIGLNYGIECINSLKNKNVINWIKSKNDGKEVDGFLIAASTKSSSPITLAAEACRRKGRIVLVGVTGLSLNRDIFYKKELSFQVSCSYGPGRYDPNYETKSNDYPIDFVRWTIQRNLEAFLEAINNKSVKVENLITHEFKFSSAKDAYDLLISDSNYLGIVLKYPNIKSLILKNKLVIKNNISEDLFNNDKYSTPILSFIGAGNYASSNLLPNFQLQKAVFETICANNGEPLIRLGKKYGFKKTTTESDQIFKDKKTNAVVISTRHDSHAEMIIKSLKSQKNVFVEKPLCLNHRELKEIIKTYNEALKKQFKPVLMVGYNRRFSSLIQISKKLLEEKLGPKSYIYTINSGYLDKNHWLQDKKIGGGRLVGEACHFIDLICYLDNSEIEKIDILRMVEDNPLPNTFTLNILFKSGSIANINYFSNGNKSFPKERIDIYSDGSIINIDNFKKIKSTGFKKDYKKTFFKQDKGQEKCIKQFLKSIRNKSYEPIPIRDIFLIQEKILSIT